MKETPPQSNAGRVPEITLHHRLRIAREFAGMDQSDLAEAISVARSTISNAENGTGNPRQIMLNAWALATGVSVEWLVNGTEAVSA